MRIKSIFTHIFFTCLFFTSLIICYGQDSVSESNPNRFGLSFVAGSNEPRYDYPESARNLQGVHEVVEESGLGWKLGAFYGLRINNRFELTFGLDYMRQSFRLSGWSVDVSSSTWTKSDFRVVSDYVRIPIALSYRVGQGDFYGIASAGVSPGLFVRSIAHQTKYTDNGPEESIVQDALNDPNPFSLLGTAALAAGYSFNDFSLELGPFFGMAFTPIESVEEKRFLDVLGVELRVTRSL